MAGIPHGNCLVAGSVERKSFFAAVVEHKVFPFHSRSRPPTFHLLFTHLLPIALYLDSLPAPAVGRRSMS